jgi:hypothetical protein
MIGFHVPSFRIDSGYLVGGQGAIASHPILNAHATILGCEDLLNQQEREIDPFQIDFQRGLRFKCHLVEPYPLTVAFGLRTQGDFAIGLEGHAEGFVQVVLNEQPVVSRAVPDIVQNIPKRDLVAVGCRQQRTVMLVFTDGRTAFLFAILFIDVVVRLRHDTEPNRQTVAACMVQTCHEIDALDAAVLAMVVVPTDDRVLVGMRLLSKAIVEDDYPVFLLDLPYIRLHDLPQLGRPKSLFPQQALNLVMAYLHSRPSVPPSPFP